MNLHILNDILGSFEDKTLCPYIWSQMVSNIVVLSSFAHQIMDKIKSFFDYPV